LAKGKTKKYLNEQLAYLDTISSSATNKISFSVFLCSIVGTGKIQVIISILFLINLKLTFLNK